MDLPPGFDTSLGQRLAEAVPIRVILEEGVTGFGITDYSTS
jgi:hypothetical protein